MLPNSKTLIDSHFILFLDCGVSDVAQILSDSSSWFVSV